MLPFPRAYALSAEYPKRQVARRAEKPVARATGKRLPSLLGHLMSPQALTGMVYARTHIGSSMSVMPNASRADIRETKVLGYLLNAAHPDGASKAVFFMVMGFRAADWRALRQSLAEIARTGQVRAVTATGHGVKYIIDGELSIPRGRSATLRTIWIIDHGADVPRLVTAYPAEEGDDERA